MKYSKTIICLSLFLLFSDVSFAEDNIIEAARLGDEKGVSKLLSEGASANAKDNADNSPMGWAVTKRNIGMVKLLLANGATPNTSVRGYPVLTFAASNGDYEIVKELVDKGVRVNDQAENGWTALMMASAQGYLDIVNLLLDKGAKMNLKNKIGRTALMIASMEGPPEIIKILVDRGADTKIKDKYGKTAMIMAQENNRTEAVQALKEAEEMKKQKKKK